MPEVRQTQQFRTWLRRLKDSNAVARIVARIRRMEQGNFGDTRSVGAGIMELRIDYGPGYRIYYVNRGAEIVILLCVETSARSSRISGAPMIWPVTWPVTWRKGNDLDHAL
jgi:putative addiction module killer protein